MARSSRLHQSTSLMLESGQRISLVGEDRRCPLCGSLDKGAIWAKVDAFEIRDCATCHTLHLTPLPDPSGLFLLYNTCYFEDAGLQHGYFDYRHERRMIERTYRTRLKRIRQSVSAMQLSHVHEIGSALGFGLPIAEELFRTRISSSDISREAVEACRKMGYQAYLSDQYGRTAADIEADLVYSFDVIEHVPNIRLFIDWLSSIIRPGGFFCLTTPNMNHPINRVLRSRSPSVKIPQHVIYFTETTLTRALSAHFRFINSFWDYQMVPLGSLLARISHILGLPSTWRNAGPAIPIYNGMELYIFKRI